MRPEPERLLASDPATMHRLLLAASKSNNETAKDLTIPLQIEQLHSLNIKREENADRSSAKFETKTEPGRFVREGATSFLESTELNVDKAVAAPAPWIVADIIPQF